MAGDVVICGAELLDGKEWNQLMPDILQKKKILILADWYEPGYKAGGPIQSVKNFVYAMHEAYSISVLTADTDLGETQPYGDVQTNQWIDKDPGIKIYYASRKLLNSRLLSKLIGEENPDFIYLNSLYSIRFSIMPLMLLWRKKIKAKVVLSPRGMLRESAIRFKKGRKKLFISLLNKLNIPEKIRFHATDEQEKKDVMHYFPSANLMLISNFSASLPSLLAPIEKKSGSLHLIFISRIMEIKNIQFLLRLLNEIPGTIGIQFSVYGEIEDAVYWEEAQKLIQQLPQHVHVSYLGSLPHIRVIPAMESGHVFVLPTKGENFGHAIFEALSAGRPVLISDRTPWLGLRDKEIGWDLSLDNPGAWTEAIQEAAAFDQFTYDSWSMKSREFARQRIENPAVKNEYLKLFS